MKRAIDVQVTCDHTFIHNHVNVGLCKRQTRSVLANFWHLVPCFSILTFHSLSPSQAKHNYYNNLYIQITHILYYSTSSDLKLPQLRTFLLRLYRFFVYVCMIYVFVCEFMYSLLLCSLCLVLLESDVCTLINWCFSIFLYCCSL